MAKYGKNNRLAIPLHENDKFQFVRKKMRPAAINEIVEQPSAV